MGILQNQSISGATAFQELRDALIALLNVSSGVPILAEGTNSATIKTTGTITFAINGIPHTAYAGTDSVAMTACAVQPVSTFCKYLVSINAAGTITTTKGNDAATALLALLPDLLVTDAPIGYFQVATDTTHTFTSGTTDLSASGITATFGDLNSVLTVS